MPKIIKSGIFSIDYGFPEKPPKGLSSQCNRCFAVLETVENEVVAEVGTSFNRSGGFRLPGWKIPCPECGKKVFFISEEIPPKIFKLLNGGDYGFSDME